MKWERARPRCRRWQSGSGAPAPSAPPLPVHRTESVYKVVLKKSTPPQIRQLILYYYKYEELVNGFVWELTFAKRLQDRFVWDESGPLRAVHLPRH